MIEAIKKNKAIIIFTVLLIIVILSVSFFVVSTTAGIGSKVGEEAGSLIGKVKGTIEGRKEGKEAAFFNPDTDIDVVTEIQSCGSLQILEMNIKIDRILYEGGSEEEYKNNNFDNVKYAEYITRDGTAIFKIDLSNAKITQKNNSVEVDINDDIEIMINLSTSSIESKTNYQEKSYTGSTADGTKLFQKANNELIEKEKLELSQDETVMEEARKSAKTQITNLVKAVCGNAYSVKLKIDGKEVND